MSGGVAKEDPNVGTGLVGAPECGDVDEVADEDQSRNERHRRGKVHDVWYWIAIASFLHLRTEWVKGKTTRRGPGD